MKNFRIITIAVTLLFSSLSVFSQVNELLDSIKKIYAPDLRVAIWNIKATNNDNVYTLRGKVDNPKAKNAIINAMNALGIKYSDNILVLPEEKLENKWALVKIAYAHLRTNPGHEHELTSQALMGTPLRVLESKDGWLRVQTPDNYISWVINNSTVEINTQKYNNWKNAKRYVVTAIYSYLYESSKGEDIVSDLVLGDILEYKGSEGNYIKLSTPDGRLGYASKKDIEDLSTWVNQSFDSQKIVSTAKMLMGSTYTWGGTSTKGVDCSGLTKTCYFANGIILQRDASQQVLYGTKIAPADWNKAKKGDLLYFGTKSGRVTHTAIYIGNGIYIHASGRVKINSVDPKASGYLTTPFLSINRISDSIDKAGIVSVKNSPYYFNK